MTPVVLVPLVAGLLLLIVGAEVLVRAASRLALSIGVTPLTIGLTVVAFGTSAPEMAVSVSGAVHGQGELALGNVIGSNIFNVLCILGLAAAITPLIVQQQLVRLDVPLMIGASAAVWLLAADGRLGRLDGALLFGAIVLYTAALIRHSRRSSVHRVDDASTAQAPEATAIEQSGRLANLLWIGLGLGALVIGSRWLVESSVQIAQWAGVSELIIGLTIVALGTSLPEAATSVVASLRGQRDLAVGNVVGSNIFNLLAVLGLGSLVAPEGITVSPQVLRFDLPVMMAVAAACLPIFFSGHMIARGEGLLFLGYYVAYTGYLLLAIQQDTRLDMLQAGVLYFALPITVLTLLVLAWRYRQEQRQMTL